MIDFDENVQIVDTVIVDHISEDDKSTASEEVTYERWTEERKLFKTKIFKDGKLIDEIIEHSKPELVGDILREKLIERHEHIKHISQDIFKRVKLKPSGQSKRQSSNNEELKNLDFDDSSVLIIKPTHRDTQRRNSTDNAYFIQHQQVITSSDGKAHILTNTNSQITSGTNQKFDQPINDNYNTDKAYLLSPTAAKFTPRKNRSIFNKFISYNLVNPSSSSPCSSSSSNNKLELKSNNFIKLDLNLKETQLEEFKNKDTMRDKSELSVRDDDEAQRAKKSTSMQSFLVNSGLIKRNESEKKTDSITKQADSFKLKSESDEITTTSDSLESMEKFKRPTKSEMQNSFTPRGSHDHEENLPLFLQDAMYQDSSFAQKGRIKNFTLQIEKMENNAPLTGISIQNLIQRLKNLNRFLDSTRDLTSTESKTKFATSCLTDLNTAKYLIQALTSNEVKTVSSNQELRTELTKYVDYEFSSNEPNFIIENLNVLKVLVEEKFDFLFLEEEVGSYAGSATLNPSESLSNQVSKNDDKLDKALLNQESRDDLTDVSDNEEDAEEVNAKLFESRPSSVLDRVKVLMEDKPTRIPPFRRESFELARESSTKRLLTEIKPKQEIDFNEDLKKPTLNESSGSSSDSTDSTSSMLRRNYEILRRKSNERRGSSALDEDISFNKEILPESSSITLQQTNKPTKPAEEISSSISATNKTPNKIKFVKKQRNLKQQANHLSEDELLRARSVSPGLRRGPDIVETIETTTSMSFIINKRVDLLVEEKIENPSEINFSLTSSIPQARSSRDREKSVPIPITVQSRSKSEPKLDKVIPIFHESEFKSNHNQHQPLARTRLVVSRDPNNNELKIKSNPGRLTFHRYDSNEIIAVVDSNNWKSEPDLNKKFEDDWNRWPEYAVDQETDSSLPDTSGSKIWVRDEINRKKRSNINFEIEIEKRPIMRKKSQSEGTTSVTIDGRPLNANVKTHKDGRVLIENVSLTPGSEITIRSKHIAPEASTATRMSSGYFSGDEFRSYFNSINHNIESLANPELSSSNYQFDINKFLKKTRSKQDALDEFNEMYENLKLEDDPNELNKYKYNLNGVNRRPDTVKDDMARRRKLNEQVYNNSLQNKSPVGPETGFSSNDLSNTRKRSNSTTSMAGDSMLNQLILPSPTSADYLRNKTRESALINVIMNPERTTSDFELNQILYDDMAFRQLRKDSEAHKLSQINATSQIAPSRIPSPLTNITTLPVNYNSTTKTNMYNNYAATSDYYDSSYYESHENYSRSSNSNQARRASVGINDSMNSLSSSSNSIKTVKMVKQKDAMKQKDTKSLSETTNR